LRGIGRSSILPADTIAEIDLERNRPMRDFAPDDRDAVIAFDRAVTDPTARAVLDYLIAHPDQRFNGAALVKALNLSEHKAVARATYAMGQIAAGLDRSRPWGEAQMGYQMAGPIAALFLEARGSVRS
jgi:hypothetical protein